MELEGPGYVRKIGHPVKFPNDGLPPPLTFPSLFVLINFLFELLVLFVLISKYYSGDQNKEQELSEECCTSGGEEKLVQGFARNA